MATHVPTFSTRLVKRLVPAQDHEALLGDITEEKRRRSRLWYWGQVCALIVVGSWRDLRRHPVLALRAIGIGITALVAMFAPALALLRVVRVLSEGGYYLGPYWLTLPSSTIRWIPALMNTFGFGAAGWAIARSHRSHGITMLMPFALLSCLIPAIALVNLARHVGPWIFVTPPRIGPLASTLSIPLCVLLGGLLGLSPAREEHRKRT